MSHSDEGPGCPEDVHTEDSMIRPGLLLFCAFVAFFALMSGTAWADGLPVQNASFETSNPLNISFSGGPYNLGPIPGWNSSGVAGSWAPNSSEFSAIPDGSIVAYTNDGSISQTLTGSSVQPNSSYTLSVFVGNRLDGYSGNGNYTISLDAGSTTLCSFTGNSASITAGTFADETCSYQSGSIVPSGDLSIVLTSNSSGAQLDIEEVSVSDPVSTPEPGSLLLVSVGLFCVLFILVLRRKQELHTSA